MSTMSMNLVDCRLLPVATIIDIPPDFQFGPTKGVFSKGDGCDNYKEEDIPRECQEGEGYTLYKYKLIKQRKGEGYTCLGDCKDKLPKHCDR